MTTKPMCEIDIPTIKAVCIMASVDQCRPYLCGVHVTATPENVTYVSTNGHCMFAQRINCSKNVPNTLTGSWIVPRVAIGRFKKPTLIHSKYYLKPTDDPTVMYIGDEYFAPIVEKFPDWVKLIPRAPFAGLSEDHSYNPRYLYDFQRVGEMCGIGPPVITPNGSDPAIVSFPQSATAFGIIMPMRGCNKPAKVPLWIAEMQSGYKAVGDIIGDSK